MLMSRTFGERQSMRREGKSATEVSEKYPRLLDYNGAMVNSYFEFYYNM